MFSLPTRRWIYGVVLAAQPLAVGYGLLTDTLAALWVGVAGALIMGPLALANPTKEDDAPKHAK